MGFGVCRVLWFYGLQGFRVLGFRGCGLWRFRRLGFVGFRVLGFSGSGLCRGLGRVGFQGSPLLFPV